MKLAIMRRILQTFPLLILVVILILAPTLIHCAISATCIDRIKVGDLARPVIYPLQSFAMWAIVGSAILPFVSQDIFRSLLKFVAYFLPIAFLIVASTSVSSPYLFDFYPFHRTDVAGVAGGVFTAGTLIVVFYTWWRRRVTK